jgi:MoxR-like ATPase
MTLSGLPWSCSPVDTYIEGVPGGARRRGPALRAIDCTFQRVYSTSDMLPSDVLHLIYSAIEQFEFAKPVLLTSCSLTRSTAPPPNPIGAARGHERRLGHGGLGFLFAAATVPGDRHPEPIEHHGTYPLPESQLDRFLMRVRMGYPDGESEREILRSAEPPNRNCWSRCSPALMCSKCSRRSRRYGSMIRW